MFQASKENQIGSPENSVLLMHFSSIYKEVARKHAELNTEIEDSRAVNPLQAMNIFVIEYCIDEGIESGIDEGLLRKTKRNNCINGLVRSALMVAFVEFFDSVLSRVCYCLGSRSMELSFTELNSLRE